MVDSKLVIRALQTDTSALQLSDVFEILPCEIFQGDIPQIQWHAYLTPLAQHDDFQLFAENFIAHSNRLLCIQPEAGKTQGLKERGDPDLLDRARIRNAVFRNHDCGGAIAQSPHDVYYGARDQSVWSVEARRSYEMASLVHTWSPEQDLARDMVQLLRDWEQVGGYDTDFAEITITDLTGLEYENHWGSLYNLSRRSVKEPHRYRLMFLFGTIAWGQSLTLMPLRTLLAIAVSARCRDEEMAAHSVFDFSYACDYDPNEIRRLVRQSTNVFPINTSQLKHDNPGWEESKVVFDQAVDVQSKAILLALANHWPSASPMPLNSMHLSHIQPHKVVEEGRKLFIEWKKNAALVSHLQRVQELIAPLHKCGPLPEAPDLLAPIDMYDKQTNCFLAPKITEIMDASPAFTMQMPQTMSVVLPVSILSTPQSMTDLTSVIKPFLVSQNETDQKYGEDLLESLAAFSRAEQPVLPEALPYSLDEVRLHQEAWVTYVDTLYHILTTSCGTSNPLCVIQELGGLMPRVTPKSLLRHIASCNSSTLNDGWNDMITKYGTGLTMLHRAERLVKLSINGDVANFYKECGNIGHQTWDVRAQPDWLLIEVENNFLIRPVQARIAQQMISPSSGKNSVFQLNMGEGKTSVIIPLLVSALANGNVLAR